MVGKLYKTNDVRRDAGFSVFYAGINIGALLGGYACITIGKEYSWHLAFGLAAIVMTISLLTFLFTQKSLGPIGLPPGEDEDVTDISLDGIDDKVQTQPAIIHRKSINKKWYDYAVYAGSLAIIPVIMIMVSKTQYTDWFMYTIGPATLLYLVYEMAKYGWAERKKVIAALVFIFFSILFWAFFEQCGGSLSLFAARNLDNTILGVVKLDPNGVNNAANSFFVIIFAFIFSLIWIGLAKKKIEPNTVIKFGLSFIFLSGSFFIFYSTRFFANEEGISSLDIFTLAYLVMTFAELCLSPIGLSIMTKLSPEKLQGVMMGMWFLAAAYGQYVAGLLGAGMAEASENDTPLQKLMTYTEGYKQLAIYALIAGIILLILSPVVKKLMQEVK